MSTTKLLIAIVAATGLLTFASPVQAGHRGHGHHHHHHGHSHGNVGFFVGGWGYPFYWGYPYWGYPYYYGYPSGYPSYGYPAQGVYQGKVVHPNNEGLSKDYSMATQVQQRLAKAGYYEGEVDGIIGEGTRRAIRDYQRDNDLTVDGRIGNELLRSIGLG